MKLGSQRHTACSWRLEDVTEGCPLLSGVMLGVFDVTFLEDASRIRRGHSPKNFTLLRRMAISLLNQETNSKRSLRQKAKLAATNNDYMMKVLASASS